ncbi:hypothetical protein GSY69_10340 [Brevibacterium sp. 5221]|uniref:AMP-dependent synthetase/ligase domain-containing protein n=1 Tax=Brevibacterium rongguiense TaxID=2695267 RepID=A0A6N9H943_9MICO|nr:MULTISPECIES: propionyl-CoA synthetase [Brevibacterium]MYM20351.1 hypothetical protein [Brevibacterium rongguiense]WAL41266.1 hypothetical protein BRM1_05295 [Brevibacterium sp. BRM-1]
MSAQPHWFAPPGRLGEGHPGTLNPVYERLDRAIIDGRADEPALAGIGPDGARAELTVAEALDRVAKIAGALRLLAVGPGVPVRIASGVAPLTAELAALAVQRIGGTVVWGAGDAPGAPAAPVVIEPDAEEPAGASAAERGVHSAFAKPLRRLPSRVEGTRVRDERDGASLDALVRDGRIEPAAVEPLPADQVIEIAADGARTTALEAALSSRTR